MNCKELGYKVGDRFEMIESHNCFKPGDKVILQYDDDSSRPSFKGIAGDGREYDQYIHLHKLKPLEKTMDIKEAYKIMSQNCGIKVGDTVKVLRGWKEGELGTGIMYHSKYSAYIGKEYAVLEIHDEGQIRIKPGRESFTCPFFVLEKVKDAEESIIIDGHVVEFNKGSIKVGCQKIDFETIKKIYDRAKSTL